MKGDKEMEMSSAVFLAVSTSTVSCRALSRVRMLVISEESIWFSWYMSFTASEPSSPTILLPWDSTLSCCISCRRIAMALLALSWFTITLFLMLRARLAYFRVFSVSMKSVSLGETQAIIRVRLLPV
ncbi:hypothetical protein E2C01_011235 [Portunus trituberculatus]|uniref:Uncharacterized protein n=1 Tax=Portunus trituberculatus TaxID=210409 RepID=A0A5B7DAS4_PORTR|nr:hypothetical protein [Portunus trituberculatus]